MPADDARAPRLEPTTVSTGRVLLVVASLFAMLGAALAALAAFYAAHAGPLHVAPTRFPAPQLETNIDPRSTVNSGHGPRPYGRRPPQARAQETAPAPVPLADAMDAVAARGDAGYDPPPGAAAPPQAPGR